VTFRSPCRSKGSSERKNVASSERSGSHKTSHPTSADFSCAWSSTPVPWISSSSGTWTLLSQQPAVSRGIPHTHQFGTLPPRYPVRVAGVVLYHDARFVGRPTGGTGTSVTGSGESGGPSTPTTARESGAQHPTPGRPARNNSSNNSYLWPDACVAARKDVVLFSAETG
jgi:hypothetical protein